jgi:integrase
VTAVVLANIDADTKLPADRWQWPIVQERYDRSHGLAPGEAAALRGLGVEGMRRVHHRHRQAPQWRDAGRLLRPLEDVNMVLEHSGTFHQRRAVLDAVAVVLLRCSHEQRSFWAWTQAEWLQLIGRDQAQFLRSAPPWADGSVRPCLVAYGYLLGGFTDFGALGKFSRAALAWRVFGRERVDAAVGRIREVLAGWGYRLGEQEDKLLPTVVCQLLLLNRSPHLEDLSSELFQRVRQSRLLPERHCNVLHAMQRAAAALGLCEPPALASRRPRVEGMPPLWARWVERWHATSTLAPRVRGGFRTTLFKVGRWLAAEHPEITEPTQWTRQTCAAWVAALDRMKVGDFVQRSAGLGDRAGKPLSASTKATNLTAVRTFYRDCQEWEWLPRRFDPQRVLGTPRSIAALVGPNPRTIADEVWAKLLWAGLHLTEQDLPASRAGAFYPLELVRAMTLTWLFSGQRSDEIARLRLGCIRWQHGNAPIDGDSDQVLARDAACLLDVPVHKTGTAFTKPVDPVMGQAVDVWQAARPEQPRMLDRRTGEHVDFLFAFRARRVPATYINTTLIPMLCRKAGVPTADVRGTITSHRARSTIASQLYNAKEPMTLFELQAWLGHRSPQSTQHYAKLTPTTLTRAYKDAGYFARNVRTIEVLLDRDAITSGTAASGEPWQYYDLGHGWCSYTFFEQCPHRMACARCDFYTPKDSTKAQLLEAKDNLQRMLASVPLTDDERPPSTTARRPLTSSSNGSPTSPPLLVPPPASSASRQP